MSVQTEIDRIIGHVSSAYESVKAKGGTAATPYLIANLSEAIDTIPEAVEPTLQEKTVSPSTSAQSVTPDSGYDGLSKVTVNAMTTATQATPSISVSSSGLITASATQSAGYVAAGTKSATKQLTTQAAQTITPGTSNKTIASGRYLTGTQTIKGDANLVAGNIKSGVSIFGVAGTMTAGEDVTAETNTYTSHLTELESAINSLPDAGSGGGSGGNALGTCTINVSYVNNAYCSGVVYTSVANGEIVANLIPGDWSGATKAATLNNVLCGSAVYISTQGVTVADSIDTGGVQYIGVPYFSNDRVYKAPTTPGAAATIRLYDNA